MDIEQLTKLNELKEKGIITQEEFETKKQQLLVEPKKENQTVKSIDIIIKILICVFLGIILVPIIMGVISGLLE